MSSPDGLRVLRLYPPPQQKLPAAEVYADLSLPERDEDLLPYVLINMVSSVDGRVSLGGKASGIGSAADRLLMDTLRSRVDAVMIGAGTLRAEKLTLGVSARAADRRRAAGLRPQPLAVILAGSSDPCEAIQNNLIAARPDNTLVFVPEGQRACIPIRTSRTACLVSVVPAGGRDDGLVDLGSALITLRRDYGIRHLLVEGGPRLNGGLVSSGFAHELFVTVSPKLLGTSGIPERPAVPTSIIEGLHNTQATIHLDLISAYLLYSELFLRYALRSSEPT